jgi:hypothetical protein
MPVSNSDGIPRWILAAQAIQQLTSDKAVLKVDKTPDRKTRSDKYIDIFFPKEFDTVNASIDVNKLRKSAEAKMVELMSSSKNSEFEAASRDLSAMIVKLHVELQTEKDKAKETTKKKTKEIEVYVRIFLPLFPRFFHLKPLFSRRLHPLSSHHLATDQFTLSKRIGRHNVTPTSSVQSYLSFAFFSCISLKKKPPRRSVSGCIKCQRPHITEGKVNKLGL